MFYHALTGNGVITPVEPVLLWENSSPTTPFVPQSISLDLTDYAGIIVEFNRSSVSAELYSRTYVKKGDTFNGAGNYSGTMSYCRNVAINDNTVSISGAYPTGSDSTPDNNILIPNKIYGVKEYVVEPQISGLLWTNPAPTAEFGAKKISVNLTNSRGVVVEFMLATNNQTIQSRLLIFKGETSFGVGYTAGVNSISRMVTAVEDNGVTFANGRTASSDDSAILIPYKIYAIN